MVIRRLNLEIQGLPQSYIDENMTCEESNVDFDSYTYEPGPYSPPPAGPETIAVRPTGHSVACGPDDDAPMGHGRHPGDMMGGSGGPPMAGQPLNARHPPGLYDHHRPPSNGHSPQMRGSEIMDPSAISSGSGPR